MNCIYCNEKCTIYYAVHIEKYYCSRTNHYYSYDNFLDIYSDDNNNVILTFDKLLNGSWKVSNYYDKDVLKIIEKISAKEINKIINLYGLLK